MPHPGPTEPLPRRRLPLLGTLILLAASMVVTITLSGIAELVVLGLISTAPATRATSIGGTRSGS